MSVFRHVFLRWCGVCYFFPRCCDVDSPPMSPSSLYLKPLRNSDTFPHVIYKSKKKINLLCILNNVFQYSKIWTRKRNAKKSIKTEKNLESSPFWNPESSTRNPESTGWNPESKTVMDSLTWGETWKRWKRIKILVFENVLVKISLIRFFKVHFCAL